MSFAILTSYLANKDAQEVGYTYGCKDIKIRIKPSAATGDDQNFYTLRED